MTRVLSLLVPALLLPAVMLAVAVTATPAQAQLQDLLPELQRDDDPPATPEAPEPAEPATPEAGESEPTEPTEPQAEGVQPPTPPNAQPPTPPNAPENAQDELAEWWVSPAGNALGPYSVSQLRQMAADGKIDGNTPIWKEGMTEWVLLKTVPALQQVAEAVPKSDEPNMPPPPKDSQKLLDEQMKAFLLGTWYFEDHINQGGVSYYYAIELTYRNDGTFAGYETIQLPPQYGVTPPPVTNPRSGSFKVTAIDEEHFVLTLNDRGGGGASGAGGQSNQASLRIVDRNTVEDVNNPDLRSYRVR